MLVAAHNTKPLLLVLHGQIGQLPIGKNTYCLSLLANYPWFLD